MKNIFGSSGMVLLLAALVLMITEASVVAQDPGQGQRGERGGEQGQRGGDHGHRGHRGGEHGKRGGERGGRQGASPLMRLFDADGDGAISANEIDGAIAILKKWTLTVMVTCHQKSFALQLVGSEVDVVKATDVVKAVLVVRAAQVDAVVQVADTAVNIVVRVADVAEVLVAAMPIPKLKN